jgi:predicted PurR-regulated permease PerM
VNYTLTLSPLTNVAILVMALGQLLLVASIVFLAFKLKTIISDTVKHTLDETLPRVQPVIDNAVKVSGQVSDIVDAVAPRVRNMAADSESAVHTVSAQVKTTSRIVTEGVARPMASLAALFAGLQQGLSVWRTAKTQQGDAAKPEGDSATD